MRHPVLALLLIALGGAPMLAGAQDAAPLITPVQVTPVPQRPANEQIIEPQVDRRPVKRPRFPSNDFEIGVFMGTYATESFGTNRVSGLRFGYHITEDIFVEAAYGRTKVRDESFRQILPAGIFPNPREPLTYYNVSAGLNILPGEVFIGSSIAKPSGIYLIGGLGSTKLADQRHQTANFGLGVRLFLKDWAAIQVDMRDHIFALDVLGKRQSTQNLELTIGATFFF